MSWLSGIVDSVSSFFDSGAGKVVGAVAGAAADAFEGSQKAPTSSGRNTLIQRPNAKYNPTERLKESDESRAAPVMDARATQEEWMQMFKRHWDETTD